MMAITENGPGGNHRGKLRAAIEIQNGNQTVQRTAAAFAGFCQSRPLRTSGLLTDEQMAH
jgi:hypothetical protein